MKNSLLKYIIRFVLLSLCVGVISCSYDDVLEMGNGVSVGEQEMNFDAQIVQEYVTRVNDSGFADGDVIGLFVAYYDGDNAPELTVQDNYVNNMRFTYNHATNTWKGDEQLYWKNSYTPIDAYGYYPYDDNLASVSMYPFAVRANQNDNLSNSSVLCYEISDFLWAKAENISPSKKTISLKHNHIMAGVQVTLIEGGGFEPGEWEQVSKRVTIENTYLNSTINLESGVATVDKSGGVESITPVLSSGSYRAIVVPQVVEAGKSLIDVTINDVPYSFCRDEAMAYTPGKLHKFTLKVDKRMPEGDYVVLLAGESVSSWQNDHQSHNGKVREYITVHVERDEYIGDVIKRMKIDPNGIINLKLTGTLSKYDHFAYIRENMPYLEAVNLRELRTINQVSYRWNDSSGPLPYGQPTSADDYIPEGAFENMVYLSYVVWPDHLVGIGSAAFAGCSLRGSLILPEGLKHLGADVFEAYGHQSSSLAGELYLPQSLEYIGGGVFNPEDTKKCYLTGNFILPPNIKYIGGGAFAACPNLTGQFYIPHTLDVLESGAFPPNLTGNVVVPSHIKYIGGLPGKITSLHLSEGLEELGHGALAGLHSLSGDLEIPSTVKKIDKYAFSDSYFRSVKLPEGLDIIKEGMFRDCIYLQDTMKIPSTVTHIEKLAFYNCNKLSAVVLPANLVEISNYAFDRCASLELIECHAIEPPLISPSAFDGVEKNDVALVVPNEAIEAYKNAEHWREFKRISAYRNFVCHPMQAKLLNRGSVRDVVLNSDGNWEMTYCPDWVNVDVKSGYKKTQLKVTIDNLPHGAGGREDKIIFTLTDKLDENGNPIICTFNISQYDYEHDEDSELILQSATKGNNGGINITFVGDGYDAEDISEGRFLEDVREGMKYFFGVEPYKTYREYFNVYIDFALSYDSGVCSNVNIWRTTKFNSTYGANNGRRLAVDGDGVVSYVLNDVDGAMTEDNINESLIICILNSDVYEGITQMWSSGAAVAFVPHCRGDYPNDYRGVIQHEAGGHGFGKLADEYIYHPAHIVCDCECCDHVEELMRCKSLGWYRNVTLDGKYSTIEWRHLIFHDNYSDIVDIYEGAYKHLYGVYRSEANSCMNNNVPYFSSVSRQTIVERIKAYSGEEFSFDEWVANDSRDYGEFTRSSVYDETPEVAIYNPTPIIIMGSVLDNIKTE